MHPVPYQRTVALPALANPGLLLAPLALLPDILLPMLLLQNLMAVFGGQNQQGALGDFWVLDLNSYTWTKPLSELWARGGTHEGGDVSCPLPGGS